MNNKEYVFESVQDIIKNCDKTQIQVAKILGVLQPEVSLIKNGHQAGFSIERLMDFIDKLGWKVNIEITIKK